MSLDDRIRQSIERNTAAPGHDPIPEGLLHRARRRIALTVVGSLVSLAVLGGGGLALVRSLDRPEIREPGGPTTVVPSETPSEPTLTPEERAINRFVTDFMEARRAGSGAEAFLSPEAQQDYVGRQSGFVGEGAVLYGDEERPLDGFEIQAPHQVEGGSYEVLVWTLRHEIGDTPWCPFSETLLVDPDANGGDPLVVSSVENTAGTVGTPVTRRAAEGFGCVFMDARQRREDLSGFLSPEAQQQLESGEAGLSAYPEFVNGWWIAYSELAEDGEVIVILGRQDGEAPDYSTLEEIRVGPGADANGQPHPAVVRSVRPVECDFTTETPSCG